MVQIQSSLFPLYDRNPQTYVENIMFAKPGDYRKATQSVWFGGGTSSGGGVTRTTGSALKLHETDPENSRGSPRHDRRAQP